MAESTSASSLRDSIRLDVERRKNLCARHDVLSESSLGCTSRLYKTRVQNPDPALYALLARQSSLCYDGRPYVSQNPLALSRAVQLTRLPLSIQVSAMKTRQT